MNHKKSVKNQNYEDYWQLTLGNTDFYGTQFVRILKLMVDHIDKYGLADKSDKADIHDRRINHIYSELTKEIVERLKDKDKLNG